jgi:O-antigen/teichoic acid export membrane protein
VILFLGVLSFRRKDTAAVCRQQSGKFAKGLCDVDPGGNASCHLNGKPSIMRWYRDWRARSNHVACQYPNDEVACASSKRLLCGSAHYAISPDLRRPCRMRNFFGTRRPVEGDLRRGSAPKGLMGNVGRLSAGAAIGQAATLAVSPLLTRLYNPADFGTLAVFTILLALFSPWVSLRYEQAVPIAKSDKDADALAIAGLVAAGSLSVVVTLLCRVVIPMLPLSEDWTSLGVYLWGLIPALWLVNVVQVMSYWHVRAGSYSEVARSTAYRGVGGAGAQVIFGVAPGGPLGLIVGYVVGQGIGCYRMTRQYVQRSSVRTISWGKMIAVAARYPKFPLVNTPAAFLDGLGLQLPYLLFAFFYGPVPAGLFLLAQRVARVPMQLIGQSVSQAYFGHVSEAARDPSAVRAGEVHSAYWSTARRLFLLGVAPAIVIVLIAPQLFAWIFGQEWREAGVYTQAMILAALAQFVVSPISLTLVATNRQELQLVWEAARLVVVTAAILVPHYLSASAQMAIVFISAGQVLMYVALFVLMAWVVRSWKGGTGRPHDSGRSGPEGTAA